MVPSWTNLFLASFKMRLFLPGSLYPWLLPSTAFPNCCLLGRQLGKTGELNVFSILSKS